MGEKLLVIGETGSGKTTSLRNLPSEETFLINVINKPLPFKGWKGKYKKVTKDTPTGNMVATHDAEQIVEWLKAVSAKRPEIKTIVVDDAQYVMSYEFMARAMEKGFDKFTQIAKHMFEVFVCPDGLRDDLTVIYLAHSEDVSANGFTKTKIKTIGKMLDDKITIEGMFTIVLLCSVYKVDGKLQYFFVTKNDGSTTVKTPDGMFEKALIPNDLNNVLKVMHKYYEGE